ncbi:hypothetical protein [Sulfolobus sp. B1]|uniref:hypothetical protein n=1 Tax=Sulfolobus sp. B1 TaxID=2200888 RepID=UPI0021039291|nr:hypothetical protein [Sulfolobus sp. B1]
MKGVKREKVVVPILIILVALIIGTSGILTARNPFISPSVVSNTLGGKWSVQSFYMGNNTVTETLYDSSGDVLVITEYSFSTPSQALNFIYANQLNNPQMFEGYLVSYYSHGLIESAYILDGSHVFYVSYVGSVSTNLPSLAQLINLIK